MILLPQGISSYAQNFEDVFLWRALNRVENGFYIDIGAQDPRFESVSRGFYELGWRGFHVEPTLQYSERLRQDRPDELVLNVAVSDQPGIMTFYEIPDSGMSTAIEGIARRAEAAGWRIIQTTVATVTLDQVFDKVAENKDVNWLKIDVEGFETAVIEGWRKSAIRPWIVVVEAISPTDHLAAHESWEPMLLRKGYTFVYFDSINRYYVSNKHPELKEFFHNGPSVWDNFVLPEGARPVRELVQKHSAVVEQLKLAAASELAGKDQILSKQANDLRRASNAANQARTRLEREETALAETEATIAALEVELDQSRRSQPRLRASLARARSELDWTRKELANTEVESSNTKSALSHSQFELERARTDATADRARFDRLETNFREVRAELVEKQNEVSQARSALANMRFSQVEQLRSELAETTLQRDAARRDLDSLAFQLALLKRDGDRSRAELAETVRQLELANVELANASLLASQRGATIADLQGQRADVKDELTEASTELETPPAALRSANAVSAIAKADTVLTQTSRLAAGGRDLIQYAISELDTIVELEALCLSRRSSLSDGPFSRRAAGSNAR